MYIASLRQSNESSLLKMREPTDYQTFPVGCFTQGAKSFRYYDLRAWPLNFTI